MMHQRNSDTNGNNNYRNNNLYQKNPSNHGGRSSHHSQDNRQAQKHQQQAPSHQGSNQGHSSHFHQRDRSDQRERSGQRLQHPDSSMSRIDPMSSINMSNLGNLGSIRFTPGLQTRELPPIETKLDKNKKFCGRCRLFVGNLPHNTTEDKVKTLFERFGEVGEVYLGPKSAFAFVKMDTRTNAEAARDALDCTMFDGRSLRVRLATHAAAIRVKNLSSQVTNELLAYAFRFFGEIERAVVVVDDKGKSTGEGIVEFSKKQSALFAVKKCQTDCFMLTAAPSPVFVEPYDQHDDDEGLPEKSINKNSNEFREQRDIGPRFAEPGSFEYTFGMKWKQLHEIEKQRRDQLEREIQDARKNLQDQVDYTKSEHQIQQLKNELQKLEERRRQEIMFREKGQMTNIQMNLNEHQNSQQHVASQPPDNPIQIPVNRLHEFISNPGQQPDSGDQPATASKTPIVTSSNNQVNQDTDAGMGLSNPMMAGPVTNVPVSYADMTSMTMGQHFIPIQSTMNIPPPPPNETHNLFTSFIQTPNQSSNQANDQPSGMGYGNFAGSQRRSHPKGRPYSGAMNNNSVQGGGGGGNRNNKRRRF